MEEHLSNKTEKAYQLYNQVIESWGYSFTDENGEHYYHPTSLEQVEIAKENLKKIDELGVDDPKLKELVDNIRNIANDATKRKFAGSKWIAILAGIAVFALAWMWMDGFLPKIKGYYPEERALELYTAEVERTETQVAYYSKAESGNTGRKYTGSEENREKYYQNNVDKLEELKEITPKKFLKQKNSSMRKSAIGNLFSSLIWFGIYGAYFITSRAPVYIINRRQKALELKKKFQSGVVSTFFTTVSAMMAAPTTVTVTRYTDGRVHKQDNALIEIAMRIGIILILALIIIGLALYILPFLVVISYIRNYHFDKTDRMISWIKSKLGIKSKVNN